MKQHMEKVVSDEQQTLPSTMLRVVQVQPCPVTCGAVLCFRGKAWDYELENPGSHPRSSCTAMRQAQPPWVPVIDL